MENVVRVMQKSPERRKGDDGLPVSSYALYFRQNSIQEVIKRVKSGGETVIVYES